MLPCKKRRTTVTESLQHKGNQEENNVDLESAVKPESDQVKDLSLVSLSWDPSHGRVAGFEVQSVQDAGNQLGMEDTSLSSGMLSQNTNVPILEGVDVAISQGITLPSLESFHPLNIHIGKGKLQATGSKRGKKITLRPGPVTQEDRRDHLILKEPFSEEPSEEVKEEGGKPQMNSEGEIPSLPSGSQSAKPVSQPRKSTQPDVCASPQEKPLRTLFHQPEEEIEDGGLFIPVEEQDNEESEKRRKKKKGTKRKRDGRGQEGTLAYDLKLDDMLDRTLEDGAKQHNLTAVNVRNILHEVITNEHVVAMMKAAISETEDMPMFEPKMTRSKLKEVVEKGVVIPTWNISPIKKANEMKPPQFVDIHLEEDDSSDEEYQPDDEEEDETAEESLLESDVESTASSPRGAKKSRLKQSSEMTETDEESGILSEAEKVTTPAIRHISAEVVPMGPPPPPKPKQTRDSTFMEKLHAVDEELASSPVCMDSFQPMDDSLIAFRTRSKMPLKDVPLGQLEAELQAPDITPDMYDPNTADDEDWKMWLGGLMNDDVGNEDEADDDDDPEYNFLEDLDEPDTEDFRTDRAVRITKKEVNELMEELFETFQDEMGFSNMEDDGPEEEERVAEPRPNFNTPQALRFEEPLANLLNEQHRTVKDLFEQLKMKKSSAKQLQEVEKVKPQSEKVHQTLILDPAQRKRLQQQMQQHVQLLTQIHLLATCNPNLNPEASTTRIFLKELGTFAQSSIALHHQYNPKFQTLFQPCNLMGAMQLIEDFSTHVSIDCSPHKTVKKTANEFPCLPKQVAWILATSKVFMYPELLPVCSLKAKNPQDKIVFTKAEDNLLALGLKHFEGTEFPNPLISKYLLTCKTAHQLTVRIKNLNMNRAPDNIIKFYKKTKQLPVLVKCCEEIQPHQWKPPIEREEHRLPFWLKVQPSSSKSMGGRRSLKVLREYQGLSVQLWPRVPKTIPITTLLVNPTSFPCPLNQPLCDKAHVNVDLACAVADGENAFQGLEPKLEPQELSPLSATVFPKVEHSPGRPLADAECQEGLSENSACRWTVVKTEEGRQALEPLPQGIQESLNNPTPGDLEEIVKMEPEDATEEISGSPERDICDDIKVEHAVELDTGAPSEELSSAREVTKQTVLQKEEERSQPTKTPSSSQEPPDEGTSGTDVNKGSSKNALSSMDPEVRLSSPPGKPEDSSSVDGQSVGTPVGPETGGEKNGPEEEEEEDFDDLTQDEEDEMSSASEESVLSVPELQETMEKLTWLASERRMSQEGESEEENSQEENSEPEEEEEEEAEGMESLQKEDEMTDEAVGDAAEKAPSTFASPETAPEVETSRTPPGESIKAAGKGRNNHRARNKRGSRARASKDTSKLLLLYDEDILERDPLREQKDLAFAQAYLTRVREALQHIPGKYEDFLQVIYEFESSTQRQTTVDLYKSLQILLQDWPQLLKDFAAFLLPEQALACGLFEEQQAFEKSRKFLRQLEICFAENPSHHQKIIKVLQGCADCLPQEITELKTQMWQLLKGHDHLQDEFSIFFDHLRPAASRMGDFEEINWTEEKEYEFDGFEEVALPDVEEEEEPPKIPTASKNKRKKEIGVQNHDKETEWPDGAKDCACSCHEGGPDSKLKKSKRRSCSHCSSKVCDSKSYKSKEPHEVVGSSPHREASPMPGAKEAGQGKDVMEEEAPEERESTEATQSRTVRTTRKGEMPVSAGLAVGGTLPSPREVTLTERLLLDGPPPHSPETPQFPPKTGAVLYTVKRNHVGPEVLSCPKASPRLQKEREGQKAVSESEALMLVWDASETEKLPGTVEPPASFLSPVSSKTRDAGRRHVSGKPDTQERWLPSSRARVKTRDRMCPVHESPSGIDTSETSPKAPRGGLAKDSGTQGKGPEGEQQPKATEATVCANNSKVSSTGEKVVLWTREADRVILTMCQEQGAQPQTFSIISQQLGNKTPAEVSHRFRELMQLFHTACEASSEDEDDATSTSNADQLSDHGDLLSEEELDE
uniref:GON-4-like protein n=1 Tax=Nomascus leucogenys TaxID=61853 RepID=A0A2I3H4H7_NOMLE